MLIEGSHKRKNILTGEWVLVSPHRSQRPWQGKVEANSPESRPQFDPHCYLCPGNKRANGNINPDYQSTFVFDNDFSALQSDLDEEQINDSDLIVAASEKGICRVICFSPRHDLTLAELNNDEISRIIKTWQTEYKGLGANPDINYVQIFENKGEIMGCSNPHPHGQIWAQESIPVKPYKEQLNQLEYFNRHKRTLLYDYLQLELIKNERIVYENNTFVLLVPYWATWPFEVMILPRRSISSILEFNNDELNDFADIMKRTTVKYDNIFNTSFPYSAGIHQAPTDGKPHEEWHFHMHFYPPLLRSATVKKFMVGYEMLGNAQRDITPEKACEIIKNVSSIHYKTTTNDEY
ncbi:MAG: UDP-glucose--hexose-1-phosphate uridylyltransferase [Melioribacteraceae bacterium]|nr:UDP-glucose--hexose-1-phosphate uridylyltransferase [Melioribacteraceae bacterium]